LLFAALIIQHVAPVVERGEEQRDTSAKWSALRTLELQPHGINKFGVDSRVNLEVGNLMRTVDGS